MAKKNETVAELSFELVEVTPEMATTWLGGERPENRKINKAVVSTYAADMKAGKWKVTHQGIAFDGKGRLVDGQHRLSAIVECGKSVTLMVVRNVEDGSLDVVDGQRKRSIPDNLRLVHGFSSTITRVAWSRVIAAMETGRVAATSKIPLSLAQTVALMSRHKAGFEWAIHNLDPIEVVARAQVFGVLIFARPTNETAVDVFMQQLRKGENLKRGDPAYALREYMIANPTVSRAEPAVLARVTLLAIHAHIKGEPLSYFQTSKLALKDGVESRGVVDALKLFTATYERMPKVRKAMITSSTPAPRVEILPAPPAYGTLTTAIIGLLKKDPARCYRPADVRDALGYPKDDRRVGPTLWTLAQAGKVAKTEEGFYTAAA